MAPNFATTAPHRPPPPPPNVQALTKVLLRLLDVAKLPQATQVLATLTANGVHMLEMANKAHLEELGEQSSDDSDDDDDDDDGGASSHDGTVGHRANRKEGGGKESWGEAGRGGKGAPAKRGQVPGPTEEAKLLRLDSRPAAASGPADTPANAAAAAAAAAAATIATIAADTDTSRGQAANPRAGRTSRAGAGEAVPTGDLARAKDDGQDNGAQIQDAAAAAAHDPAREHPRHGRALLPRFSAADFLLVLKGNPLPLSEKMAAPTETSVDETIARAAGRPWQPPRSSQGGRRRAMQRGERGRGRSKTGWSWKQLILCGVVLAFAGDGLRSRAKGLFAAVGQSEGTITTAATAAAATARSATFPKTCEIPPAIHNTATRIDATIDSSGGGPGGNARGARVPLTAAPVRMGRRVLSLFSRRPTAEKDAATVSGSVETAPVPPPSPLPSPGPVPMKSKVLSLFSRRPKADKDAATVSGSVETTPVPPPSPPSPSRGRSLFTFARRDRRRKEEDARGGSDVALGGRDHEGGGGEGGDEQGVRSHVSRPNQAQDEDSSTITTATPRKNLALFGGYLVKVTYRPLAPIAD